MANSQNSADNDLEISLIGASDKKRKQIAFSVTSLLSNKPEEQERTIFKQECSKEEGLPQGSFMKMLGKFQEELSYEQDTYDLYEEIGKSTLGENNYKEHSHLKITKETAGDNTEDAYNDYRDLIVDFTPRKAQLSNFLGIIDKKQNKLQNCEFAGSPILSTSRQKVKETKSQSKRPSSPNQKSVLIKLHKVKSSNKIPNKEPMKFSQQLKESQNQLKRDELKLLKKSNVTQENKKCTRVRGAGFVLQDAFSSYYEENQVSKLPKKMTATSPKNIYKSRDKKQPSNKKCFKKKPLTNHIASK